MKFDNLLYKDMYQIYDNFTKINYYYLSNNSIQADSVLPVVVDSEYFYNQIT